MNEKANKKPAYCGEEDSPILGCVDQPEQAAITASESWIGIANEKKQRAGPLPTSKPAENWNNFGSNKCASKTPIGALLAQPLSTASKKGILL